MEYTTNPFSTIETRLSTSSTRPDVGLHLLYNVIEHLFWNIRPCSLTVTVSEDRTASILRVKETWPSQSLPESPKSHYGLECSQYKLSTPSEPQIAKFLNRAVQFYATSDSIPPFLKKVLLLSSPSNKIGGESCRKKILLKVRFVIFKLASRVS
jgi:hypothetical protein